MLHQELQLEVFTSLNEDASGTGICSSAGAGSSFSGEAQASLGYDSSCSKAAVSSRADELCPTSPFIDYTGNPSVFHSEVVSTW